MPSSTSLGSRPSRSTMRSYSSRERAISSSLESSTGTSSEYAGHDVGGREVAPGEGHCASAHGDPGLHPGGPGPVSPHEIEAKGWEDIPRAGHDPNALVPAAAAGRIPGRGQTAATSG